MIKAMKELSDSDLKKIIARRDPRYDGRFFFGVKTTGIYCRPVCPAKPKPENIVIFKSASEAEKAGFRACLRCHPELAPHAGVHLGTGPSVSRALRLIEESREEDLSVENLAARLGFSDRHLRRLFKEHLGASPIEIMIRQRLQLAKQLLTQSAHSVSDIAFAAGFDSIRRFNESFKKTTKLSPSQYRQKHALLTSEDFHLFIPVKSPYDFKSVYSYLKRHETVGLEVVTGLTYKRYLQHGKSFAEIIVTANLDKSGLDVKLIDVPLSQVRSVMLKIKNLFDADHNPDFLPQTEKLKPEGVRVPGAFDGFETAVEIILGQLISTEAAKKKQRELVEKFGKYLGQDENDCKVYAFPTAQVLAKSPVEEIGITRVKAQAIRNLAQYVLENKLTLSPSEDVAILKNEILALKGIGPWTVEMIAMRCLRDADAFPHNDLIVAKALNEKIHPIEPWHSSRAYYVHCLWRGYSS
jgi:Adenosine deaminase